MFSDLCYYSVTTVCNYHGRVSAKQNKTKQKETSVRLHRDFIVIDLDNG